IRHHRSPRAMPEFCGHVETAVRQSVDGRRVRGMNFEWKTVRLQPRPRVSPTQVFEESRLDTKKPEYTEDDVKKARLLVAKEDRTALLGLAKVGKARSADTALQMEPETATRLLQSGLVSKEYLVLCR